MRKLLLLLFMVVGVLGLTACNSQINVTVNSDGTYSAENATYFNLDDIKLMMEMMPAEATANLTAEQQLALTMLKNIKTDDQLASYLKMSGQNLITKEIDGKNYFSVQDGIIDLSGTLTKEAGYVITADKFEFNYDQDKFLEDAGGNLDDTLSMVKSMLDDELIAKIMSSVNSSLTVTMPSEITDTNGVLSADKKSVTFNLNSSDTKINFYAYTKGAGSKSDSSISLNVKSGFTNKDKVKISSSEKITAVTVNGAKAGTSKTVALDKDGVYTIEVTTKNNKASLEVVKDTTAPVVKGAADGQTYSKNVKIKYSDATSGIKSAKLNGKKIKSGKTVKANGDYTLVVTDKAGNKTTVKFTIKK